MTDDSTKRIPLPQCDLCGEEIKDPDSAFEFEGVFIHTLCMADKVEEEDKKRIGGMLEERLKQIPLLQEDSRKALEALIDITVENPDKVLRLERLHNRVESLENRVDDRIEGLKQEVETKFEGMNTKLHTSSLIINIALTLSGFLAGVVVALVLS